MRITIKLKNKPIPDIYAGVDEFYENRKGIKIVQHFAYKTVTTFIYHDAIEWFERISV